MTFIISHLFPLVKINTIYNIFWYCQNNLLSTKKINYFVRFTIWIFKNYEIIVVFARNGNEKGLNY